MAHALQNMRWYDKLPNPPGKGDEIRITSALPKVGADEQNSSSVFQSGFCTIFMLMNKIAPPSAMRER
jgi:hypothetical protein